MLIVILAAAGFLLSAYALHVEKKIAQDKNYRPVCDINDTVSCTRNLTSKHSRTLGLPNSAAGLAFYALVFVLAFTSYAAAIFYLSLLALIGSFYLAYISYYKLRTFCLVCTGIYLVNILLFIFSLNA